MFALCAHRGFARGTARYELLLKELIKQTPDGHIDKPDLVVRGQWVFPSEVCHSLDCVA